MRRVVRGLVGVDGDRADSACCRQPSDVPAAGLGVLLLEHQLPPARRDHREGHRPLVRQGDPAPADPSVRTRRYDGAGHVAVDPRTSLARLRTDRAGPPRLHGDESVGVRRQWRDDLDDVGSQPLLRRTPRRATASTPSARRDEDARHQGRLLWSGTVVARHGVRDPCLRQRRRRPGVPGVLVLHRRQITVAVTPDFTNNPDAPVNALMDKAICS
jgi:hypothetical protein